MLDRASSVRNTPGVVADFKLRPSTVEFVRVADLPPLRDELRRYHKFKGGVEPLSALIDLMDAHSIAWGAVHGRDLQTTHGWRIENRRIVDCVKRYPTRLVGIGGIDIFKGDGAVADVQECEALGLVGVAVDPLLQRVPIDDERFWPVFEACSNLKMLIVVTGGPAPFIPGTVIGDASPTRIDFVADRYPDLRLIMSHGGYPWVLEALTVAARHANVFLEVSGYELLPGGDAYLSAANHYVKEKLLFASAHPYVDVRRQLSIYATAALDTDARTRVMRANAESALTWE